MVEQLRADLPQNWTASLRAVDGAVIASVPAQLARLPPDATHLALSIGGNDALGASGILERRTGSVGEAVLALAAIAERFEADYRAMLDGVLARRLPTAICTIYNPLFPDPLRQRLAATALRVLNDPIIRIAVERGLPLVDLRLVCDDPRDYANPIEPSVRGGEKIAAAVAASALATAGGRTAVFR